MKKRKPIVGFMVCSCHNDEADQSLSTNRFAEIAARSLEARDIEVIRYKKLYPKDAKAPLFGKANSEAVVDHPRKVAEVFKKFYHEEVDCIVMYVTSFAWAQIYLQGIRYCNRPILLWCGDGKEGVQGIGMFAIKGAFDAVGTIQYEAIYGTPEEECNVETALSFIKACMVKSILGFSIFGMWGGNTLGMVAEGLDEIEWIRKFGIIVRYLESQTIINEALKISDEEIKEVYDRISLMVKEILPFENELLKKDLKFYLAHKRMIEEYHLDFDGLKCVPEVTNTYCAPCISQSLLLTEGFATGCTCVPKGALVIYIMRLLSDAPIFAGDIERVEKNGKVHLAMTGAAPFNMADETGAKIVQGPDFGRETKGMLNSFLSGKEGKAVLVRLNRVRDDYVLRIIEGQVIKSDRNDVDYGMCTTPPIATFKMSGDPNILRDRINSQYIYLCYEDIKKELIDICKLFDLKAELI
ncbi:MAG: hypothetical protein JW770_05300 [Actinobacteria bacterium]|nr:hypothetical protein [Actinomycetota bacterium]